MKIQGDSIVDTVIQFAKLHFNKKLEVEYVSDQIKKLSFAKNLELVDSIKKDDIDEFQKLITLPVEEGYGTDQTAGASRATVRAATNSQKIAARRANMTRSGGANRTTAGATNVKPTGQRATVDPDDAQRNANSDQIGANTAELKSIGDVVRKIISRGR